MDSKNLLETCRCTGPLSLRILRCLRVSNDARSVAGTLTLDLVPSPPPLSRALQPGPSLCDLILPRSPSHHVGVRMDCILTSKAGTF